MSRKLLSEIERVFKKVAEGIEEFEECYDKVLNASSTSQKEKYENDLKKEIKKLQRQRDQIKTWLQSNDIKDKQDLLHHRKLIEKQMEKFKAIEREMKTKAYSKEGLMQSVKLDPKEKEKQDLCTWLTESVDTLATQIDVMEAEAENLEIAMGGKKRKDPSKVERMEMLQEKVERHKYHTKCLERIQRLLENESLTTEQVQGIQEDVNYYVEENEDPEFIEDEYIYEELPLDDEDALFAIPGEEDQALQHPNHQHGGSRNQDSRDDDDYDDDEDEELVESKEEESIKEKARTTVVVVEDKGKKKPHKDKQRDTTPSASGNVAATGSAGKGRTVLGASSSAATAAAAAATAVSRSGNSGITIMPQPSTLPPAPVEAKNAWTDVKESVLSPSKTPGATSASTTPSLAQPWAAVASQNTSTSVTPKVKSVVNKVPSQQQQQDMSPAASPVNESPVPVGTKKRMASATSTDQQQAMQRPKYFSLFQDDQVPDAFADLMSTFMKAKHQFSVNNERVQNVRRQMVDMSLQGGIPSLLDQERPKINSSQQQNVNTPSYYPQTALPVLEIPGVAPHMDMDTLFFAFYYQNNTYQQYLAAKELNRQSWRFHKKYLTWFQRFEEPNDITDEYEQGTYVYFDYEGTWCQRKKSEFRFEFQYLEDTELS